jgi:hypothetical protein
MNIIEAIHLLKPGKILMSEAGFTAYLDEDGMGMLLNQITHEPFGFYREELLSEKWTVIDE